MLDSPLLNIVRARRNNRRATNTKTVSAPHKKLKFGSRFDFLSLRQLPVVGVNFLGCNLLNFGTAAHNFLFAIPNCLPQAGTVIHIRVSRGGGIVKSMGKKIPPWPTPKQKKDAGLTTCTFKRPTTQYVWRKRTDCGKRCGTWGVEERCGE